MMFSTVLHTSLNVIIAMHVTKVKKKNARCMPWKSWKLICILSDIFVENR